MLGATVVDGSGELLGDDSWLGKVNPRFNAEPIDLRDLLSTVELPLS